MTIEPVALWELEEVAEHARALSLASFRTWLGAEFVLVGSAHEPDQKPDEWSYSTAAHSAQGAVPTAAFAATRVIPVKKARTDIFPNVVLVGRAASNDVRLDSPSVSKLHARIHLGENGLALSDAGSRNGTLLNGRRFDGEAPLRPFSVIAFGKRSFTLQDVASLHKLLGKVR